MIRFWVWWRKLVVIEASEAIRESVEILLNNYANYAIIFTRLLDNSRQIWFAKFPPASACSWLIDRPAKLGLWLAGKQPFYSSTLVMSKRGLWSENKQIIVSLKATWLHQSPENYMWALKAPPINQFELEMLRTSPAWLTAGRAIAKRLGKPSDVLLGAKHFSSFFLCDLCNFTFFFRVYYVAGDSIGASWRETVQLSWPRFLAWCEKEKQLFRSHFDRWLAKVETFTFMLRHLSRNSQVGFTRKRAAN